MSEMSPCVSLALPVYNGANYVSEAIESVINQDFDDFELIITDNASTDDTEKICREAAARDRRIRYFRNDENLGAAANYNLGFKLASGKYFKWCAHDDRISPNYLSGAVRALETNAEAVVAYGEILSIDDSGKVCRSADSGEPVFVGVEKNLAGIENSPPSRRFHILVAAQGADNVMFGVIRRAALESTSLHRPYYMSDRVLLAELALHGTFVLVPEIVFYNREHPLRSMNIAEKQSRKNWTNPDPRSSHALEHLNVLLQYFESAYRLRHLAPLHSTLPRLVRWALHPLRLSKYTLELIGMVSPSAQQGLRRAGWHIINTYTPAVRAALLGKGEHLS